MSEESKKDKDVVESAKQTIVILSSVLDVLDACRRSRVPVGLREEVQKVGNEGFELLHDLWAQLAEGEFLANRAREQHWFTEATEEQLELVKDLPGEMPLLEALKILAERLRLREQASQTDFVM